MLLKLKNVSNFILKQVDIDIKKWEILSVLWHNGSWKTTLLKTIIGLIPVEKWNIYFKDQDITNLPVYERAKLWIGYIFQEIPEYVWIKINSYVKWILKEKFDEKRISQRFSWFGLDWEQYKDRYFDQHLSGGEKKKIEIIVTLLLEKELYLLDEVENSLDATSRVLFKNWIKELENNWTSFVIVSHNQDLIELASNWILLCNGAIQDKWNIKMLLKKYIGECENCEFIDNCNHNEKM